MSVSEAQAALDDLVELLDDRLLRQAQGKSSDAIDRLLAGAPRFTEVKPLRQSPEMEQFRQALADGLIRIDSISRVLRLLNEAVGRLLV